MLHVYLASIGGLALALGLASRRLRDLPLSEPLVALALGVLLGPAGLGLVAIPEHAREGALRITSELVLAMSLMSVALRYPIDRLRGHVGGIVLLVTVGMAGMAAISAGLSAWLLGVPAAVAWLLGAAIAPTDPVLSSNIVTGEPAERDLRSRLRVLISLESGVNDGLALPLVIVGVVAVRGQALGAGFAEAAVAVAVAVVAGVGIGHVAGRLVVAADRHRELEHSAFLALTLSLAFGTLGVVELARGSGILAVLAAGLAYNRELTAAERSEEWEVQEAVNRFLVLPAFTLFGVVLPWAEWARLGWSGVAFALAVLVLRRLPLVLALHRPLRLDAAEGAFMGWFGPVGIAAVFYLAHAGELGAAPAPVWAAGSLVVALSTVAHGVTATAGRRWLARRDPDARR